MFVDLSLAIEDGSPSLPGVLPDAVIEPILDHDASRARYEGKAEFYLGRIDMAGNTGTYVDSPFHRHRGGEDLSELAVERLAGLSGVVVDVAGTAGPVEVDLRPERARGRAVLLRSRWDRRWGTPGYWEPEPHLSAAAVDLLVDAPAALVGVDWGNVDDTTDPARPAHTRLLAAGIPVVERLRALDQLPRDGFRFFAVPPRIVRGASFPVRAFAEIPDREGLRPSRSEASR
jgi:kynurenine formamidase